MNVLVCNAGSTSLKFRLYEMPSEKILAEEKQERVTDYESGIRAFLKTVAGISVDAVGFKTVLSRDHYGVHRIDDDVIRGMEDYMTVAPAHNTFYLKAIRTFQKVMPSTPLVGVFETAFHQTIPEENFLYPLPYEWYENCGIRKFGYHGASHAYVAEKLTQELGPEYKAVSCHLGGSSSLTAIVNGRSFDTSFGMGLQCGVPQSNRCGDFDPFLVFFLHEHEGIPYEEIREKLEKNSGLLGVSGVSNDFRDVEKAAEEGNKRAALAVSMYIREVTGYIGRYAALMGGLDAVAFTGGIGEKSRRVREGVLAKLSFIPELKVFVIPANEELGVARKTYGFMQERMKEKIMGAVRKYCAQGDKV